LHDGKVSGIGFLSGSRARHAEEAIGQSEGLVSVLRLNLADLKPAEDALGIARRFFDAHQYSKALQAAKKAESLAIALDERFSRYQKAMKALQSRIASMKHLGLHTASLEAVLGRADRMVLSGIWDNGAFVANYLDARLMLERTEEEGRTLQEKAEGASNSIFMAELALESLTNLQGLVDPVEFSKGASTGLEAALHEATKELALGKADSAMEIAKDIDAKATRLKTLYLESEKALERTETNLAELRGEGVLTQRLEGQVKMARDMLGRGVIEPGATMAARLRSESKILGDAYRKATTILGDAEILHARLQREGFRSYEADAAIRDARRTIREGAYARAIEHLERALQAFARRTNARAALAKAIEETQTRVRLLKGRGLTFFPDIQEVLTRAEREFQQGNFMGSSEDLRVATVLLDQVTRAPTPKKEPRA
jgi:hypothetical protein